MAWHTHKRYVLLFVLKLLIIILLLQGCKEGTDSSTISDLLVNSNTAESVVLNHSEQPEYMISGFIKCGTKDVANAKVELKKNSPEFAAIASTITTSEGKFFFEKLAPGMYYVCVSATPTTLSNENEPFLVRILDDGTMSPAPDETNNITITVLQITRGVVFYNIKGKVYDAITKSPVEYAQVKVSGFGSSVTDNLGVFTFDELNEGTYELEISKEGFETLKTKFTIVAASGVGTSSVVSSDATETVPKSLHFSLIQSFQTNYGVVAGRIIDEQTIDGAAKCIVRVYKYETVAGHDTVVRDIIKTSQTLVDNAQTDQNEAGTFKITHLLPGRYALWVSKPNVSSNTVPIFDEKTISTPAGPVSIYSFNATDSNRLYHMYDVNIEQGKATYLANYEQF